MTQFWSDVKFGVSLYFLNLPAPLLITHILPVSDCEHLVRKMLVLDPARRHTVSQIRRHKWMTKDGQLPLKGKILASTPRGGSKASDYDEQVLRVMQSLGIDQQKTVVVRT